MLFPSTFISGIFGGSVAAALAAGLLFGTLGTSAESQGAGALLFPTGSPQELMNTAHRHLIEGNRKDLARNQAAVGFYKTKAKETKNPKHKEAYLKLSKVFIRMGQINKVVLDVIAAGSTRPARQALDRLPALEAQAQAMTGKPLEREWLTFAELEKYRERLGSAYKTESPFVLPFHKKHWDQEKVRELQRLEAAKKKKVQR